MQTESRRFPESLLALVGAFRNPLLGFCLIGTGLLLKYGSPHRSWGGLAIGGSIVLLFVGMGVYTIAFFRLPATAQERAFNDNLSQAVAEDKRIRSKKK